MINAQRDNPVELNDLQREYARELARASAEFKTALSELRSGSLTDERVKSLRNVAHGLAGSAGYFGHHALGRSARRLQQAANASANGADIPSLRSMLEVAIDVLEESARPSAPHISSFGEELPRTAASNAARVLIAEDHSVTQDILKLVLTQRGHSVDIVSDGAAALKALRSTTYDVALLDFHLPEMDGVQVVSALLAESAARPRTRFIAMTADVEGLVAHKHTSQNFDKIAPKPVDIHEICDIVESFGEEQRSNAPARTVPFPSADAAKRADEDLEALLALDLNFLRWPHDLNPERLSARALQATLRKENFDAIVIEELRGAADIASIWNAKFLHLLPVIDCTGRLGARADFDYSNPSRKDLQKVAEMIGSFNLRGNHLHRDILYSDDVSDKILARILVSGTPLSPIYDARSRSLVQYNTIVDVDVVDEHVRALTEKRYLKPIFFDRVHVCGSCRSSLFNVREECPKCRSSNIVEESYLHHFRCAYQGPESDFRSKDDLVCPKCRSELRHFGHDYDRPGIMVKCNACGHATSEPMVGFVCVSCGAHTDGDTVETRDIFSYELTEHAVGYLERGKAFLGLSENSLKFSELPLELIIALNDEAKKYNKERTPFALLEFAYLNERAIQQEGGARQFVNVRNLFLENLRSLLGDSAKVVQGRAYDYALVRGETPDDARGRADLLCRQAVKDLKQDPGVSTTVFGPEDLR